MRISYQFRIRILLILVALLIVGPPLLSTVYSQTPQFQVSETSAIEGVSGYSVDHSYQAPSRDVIIYSGNVFDSSADWVVENLHHQVYLDRWGVESVTEIQNGVRVLLEGYHKFEDNYFESVVTFRGKPSFPIMNYSNIQFSAALTVLSGNVDVSMRIQFKDAEGYDWWEEDSTTVNLQAGITDQIILNPDFTNITSNTSGWIIESAIEITLFTLVPTDVIVGEVVIEADSEVDLYPVSFDLQAQDGESLFLNPYMDRIGGFVREGWDGTLPAETYYLGLWLTNTEDVNDTALVFIRSMNETFYLREGTYSGFAGWIEFDAVTGTGIQRSGVNITFTVSSDEATEVYVQIDVTRLYLSAIPNFAYTRVEVDTANISQIYYLDLPLSEVDYLYLPPLPELRILMCALQYDFRSVDEIHSNYQLSAQTTVSKNADSNAEVTMTYNQIDVLGFTFNEAFILGFVALAGIIIIVALSIHANKKWTSPKFKPSLIPLTVIFFSIVTPWVNYSFMTSANPELQIGGNIFIPLLTTLWSSLGSSITLAPNNYLLPNIGVLALFFWLPVAYFMYQMIYKRRVISIREIHRNDSLTASCLVIGPFFIGLYYLWFCINNVCSISIGLIAAVGILPAWIIAWYLEGKEQAEARGT
ncbi:MAG: hypothetical protein ACTSSE_05425 [Candidatus Thorarchaeota archaeon]